MNRHSIPRASIALAMLFAANTSAQSKSGVASEVLAVYPRSEALYLDLHQHPELSFHEVETAAKLANELRQLGYEVTTGVGRTGIVGVMKNGSGPTVMLRTELDALPVTENTGLPFASTVRTKDDAGLEVGVAHACGHDIHMAAWIGTARIMAADRAQWRGTLVLVGQPAEELISGAKAMIADGLLTRFPRPSFAIAVHDDARLPAGIVGYHAGPILTNADALNIRIFGRGGHGARPEATVDPIVIAARTVLALQTIVSREISPFDPAVITVGAIHGGTKRNIIPDQVNLLLTIRTFKPQVRQRVLASIERVAKGIAQAAGIPDDRAPVVEIVKNEGTESTYNDPELTERLGRALKREMGAANVVQIDPLMVSEDFGRFGLDRQIPICMLNVGAVDPAKIASGARLPSLHSSEFAPVPDATIRGAVKAMAASVLELLR